jgi:hypothetical protein
MEDQKGATEDVRTAAMVKIYSREHLFAPSMHLKGASMHVLAPSTHLLGAPVHLNCPRMELIYGLPRL